MIFVGAARSVLGAVVEQLDLLGRGQNLFLDALQDVAELLDLVVELEGVLLCADYHIFSFHLPVGHLLIRGMWFALSLRFGGDVRPFLDKVGT